MAWLPARLSKFIKGGGDLEVSVTHKPSSMRNFFLVLGSPLPSSGKRVSNISYVYRLSLPVSRFRGIQQRVPPEAPVWVV